MAEYFGQATDAGERGAAASRAVVQTTRQMNECIAAPGSQNQGRGRGNGMKKVRSTGEEEVEQQGRQETRHPTGRGEGKG